MAIEPTSFIIEKPSNSDVKATCYSDGGRIRTLKATGSVVITAQAVSITGNS